MKFIASGSGYLLQFLFDNIKNKSKNNVKSLLTNKMVKVNSKVITKYDYLLKEGDVIQVIKKVDNEIDIIYEDNDLIVVNKPSGLLTISTEKERVKTLYRFVSDYIKKINKNYKIFVIHRLDKDTSGLVMFAKNEKIKNFLQNNWNEIVTRKYYAVVEGKVIKDSGTIKSYLKENTFHKTFSSDKGLLSITEYKVLKRSENTLLEINIKTGRKNQIRVHLNDINHSIVGDKKYNSKIKAERLMLHAYSIYFKMNGKDYLFETEIPKLFNTYLNKKKT